ncbi:hypothetical protein MMC26_007355 [Xylographa opegraphella]|nr:hypothetical protein [Xylographa opegraphella]
MHLPLSSPLPDSNVNKEDASAGQTPDIVISSVTKQGTPFPASATSYVLNDNNREEKEYLHADERARESIPPKSVNEIATAVDQVACVPSSLAREAPDSPLHATSPDHPVARCDANNHLEPSTLTTLNPNSCNSLAQVLSRKRKRDVDTLWSTVRNETFSVFISDHLGNEEAGLPMRKKVQLHHKKQIVTGSGDVEYFDVVCQIHDSQDISLPMSHCRECGRVNRIINDEIKAYEAWLPFQHKGNKGDIVWKQAMRRWLKTRQALANHKVELEDTRSTTQARRSTPLCSNSFSAADSARKSVRYEPACLTDENGYRKQDRYRRKSRHYIPGRYSAPEGETWKNTSNLYK